MQALISCLPSYVSQHLSIYSISLCLKIHHALLLAVTTSLTPHTVKHSPSSPLHWCPPSLPPSASACICCSTVVWSTLFALKINGLKLWINKVELSGVSVCLPWPVSSAGGRCGPDSHGAPHAGNPLKQLHQRTPPDYRKTQRKTCKLPPGSEIWHINYRLRMLLCFFLL